MSIAVSRHRVGALDVAVAGGGIVGATAALALARSGFAVALLEAREPRVWHAADEHDLRVVALAASSVALLDDLGVWAGIRAARASPYTHMQVWDSHGGARIDFDAAMQGCDRLGYIVENGLLQSALWQALAVNGVQCLCPAQVHGFEPAADRVVLGLGDDGELAARLLVAADGASSPLRNMAGIATRGRDYAQHAVVAHVVTGFPHQATAWQVFLPTGPLALLPLSDGRSSVVWSLPVHEAQRVLALDAASFCEALGLASGFHSGRILSTSARAAFPLYLQLAECYQAPRLVLLGDAAHVVHPLAGQGLNLGLCDAAYLRDVLLAARDGGTDFAAAHVLRRYARRRRSRNTLDARLFDGLARIYAWRRPWLVSARGLGLGLLDRLGPLKRRLVQHAAGTVRAPTRTAPENQN